MTTSIVNIYFLQNILERIDYSKFNTGTAQPKLNAQILKNINIKFPNSIEQQKIGKILNLINKIIALQQRKLEQLKLLKKAMLQQLFTDNKIPILRFKGFSSVWEQRKLGEITKRITRRNSELESTLPLTISAHYGLVDQRTFFDKQVASKRLESYLLLKNGEFAYNKSYSKDYPFGAIKRLNKYSSGVLSTLYIAFTPVNIDTDYLEQYYDSTKWYSEIYKRATEGARNHGLLNISPNDFFDSVLKIPQNKVEQYKVAECLKLISKCITLQQQNINRLEQMKKFLLQNMFI